MNVFRVLTSNYIINVGFVAWGSAQVIKLLVTLLLTRRVVLERLVGSGGMPSSHTALACAISIAMARSQGFASPLFGLALAFAAIVMYDAMGVRRAAGEQAKVLNRMIFEFPFFHRQKTDGKEEAALSGRKEPPDSPDGVPEDDDYNMPLIPKELKEFLGHTPFEVLGGFLLGVLVAILMPINS